MTPEPYEYIGMGKAADWLGIDAQTLRKWCDQFNVEYIAMPVSIAKTTYQVHWEQLKAVVKANIKNPRPEKHPIGRPRMEARV